MIDVCILMHVMPAIQKQTAQYKDDKEESIWHMDRLKEYAVQTSLTLGMQDWWNSSFCPAVMHIVKELSRVIETTVQVMDSYSCWIRTKTHTRVWKFACLLATPQHLHTLRHRLDAG
eukprot:Platyproteum_vivax@DN6931_c0_g1_i15.p1